MDKSLVGQAYAAFAREEYSLAMEFYRQAGSAIGHEFFRANVDICRARHLRQQASGVSKVGRRDEFADAERRIKYSDAFKVAIIADEFTTDSFRDEFTAIAIDPVTWQASFEEHQPDVFFCESAWSGADNKTRPWKGRVYASSNFQKENRTVLLEILKYCRKNGIPTIFWNKEDPTHHDDRVHDFVKTAKEFDFVFTTAAECIDSYKTVHGVKNAFVLPFATNPRLFNPVETGNRSSNVVFAGSWYANHVDRSRDMERILDQVRTEGFGLEIYDRFYGSTDALHVWPDKYSPYLKPAQPYERMPDVYKSSRFGLNFNTVTESPTMFARRVFELMSSNTLVLSNYALGTDRMFGDLIVYPDREGNRLRSLSGNDIEDIRSNALNKVLSEHTYRHRWNSMLKDAGIPHRERRNTVTVTAVVNQDQDALAAISWFQQFGTKLPGARLLLVASEAMNDLDVANLYRKFNRFGVAVTSTSYAKKYAMLDKYQPVETSHFLTIDPLAPPSLDWVANASLHLQYMTSLPIAPCTDKTRQFRFGQTASCSTLLDRQASFCFWLENRGKSRETYFV
ncbi:glycosyltransferase [Paraburkholderia dipogonis]|uniref:Glycosyltransferase n=1 Tax=Paraburkholderia dipogonis TaxID=1211383 RepID=A0ABW9B4T5_9BURK